MTSRRKFIRDCSALAASAAFVPASVMAAPLSWREVSLAEIGFKTFAALVNSRFVSRKASGDAQSLQLVLVVPSGDGLAWDEGGEQFSLFFRGDATRPLPQDTYSFEHVRIGRFEMFIVPIGCEDRSYCYYEAVFNRLPPDRVTRQKSYG